MRLSPPHSQRGLEMKHKQRKHSTLGASTSWRWINCPGSVYKTKDLPPQKEGPAAKKGTQMHEKLEAIIRKALKGDAKLSKSLPRELAIAAEHILENIEEHHEVLIEEKVDLSFIDPELFGTLDYAIVEPFGKLHVIDYKNGKGPVVAKYNTQLLYYAIGVGQKYDFEFENVKMDIIQPNANDELGHIRTWEIPIEKLKSFVPLFKHWVERTRRKNAKLSVGDWCEWCPAKMQGTCEKYKSLEVRSYNSLGFDVIK